MGKVLLGFPLHSLPDPTLPTEAASSMSALNSEDVPNHCQGAERRIGDFGIASSAADTKSAIERCDLHPTLYKDVANILKLRGNYAIANKQLALETR